MQVRHITSNSKLVFHYTVLSSSLSMEELGDIISQYLKDFTLIPRVSAGDYHSYLFIFWTDKNLEVMSQDLVDYVLKREDIKLPPYGFIVNNGSVMWGSRFEEFHYDDYDYTLHNVDGLCHVIVHNYENGVYNYRIGCGNSASEALFSICGADNKIQEGTTIDYMFVSKMPNDYYNFYHIGFRVKDSYVTPNGAFLYDVKGVFEPRINKGLNRANFIKILPFKHNSDYNKPDYYNGLGIKIYIGIPEDKVKIENGKIDLGQNILTSNKIIKFIVAKDEELRRKILLSVLDRGDGTGLYLETKLTKGDIVKNFIDRVSEAKKDFIAREKNSIESSYCSMERQKRELLENKMIYTERIKNFIPVPDIIIPSRDNCKSISELTFHIKKKGDRLVLEREEKRV